MATPTYKSEGIEELLKRVTGRDRRESIRSDICNLCGEPAKDFHDDLSRKEYTISGMCQKCQDLAFVNDDGIQ